MGAEQTPAEARDTAADRRDDAAEARDVAARARDEVAENRDTEAQVREEVSQQNRRSESERLAVRGLRDDRAAEKDRRHAADDRAATHEFLERLRTYEYGIAADRRAAAEDRRAAAEDRRAAARDRQLAAWARQQAAVEAAEMTPEEFVRSPVTPAPVTAVGEAAQAVELNRARRSGIEQQDAAVRSARQAAELAGDIAESEERVAATLRRLATHGDSSTSARRLELADQATTGMRVATERGDRLRELAERASDDLVTTALRALLNHAAASCAALAQAERSIAGAWEVLAVRAAPETAAAYRREARKASAAAATAARRADELRRSQLETTPRAVDERNNPSEPAPER